MGEQRVVIVGCGNMAHAWVKYTLEQPDLRIVALVDIQRETAKQLAAKFALDCAVYSGLDEAIKATNATLVMDVTIPAAHYSVRSTALRHGCHVMGEKPLSATMKEAEQLVALAEQSGASFAIMQNRRYNRQIRAFQQLISSGTIGKIGYVGADFFIGAHFGGFRQTMASPLLLDMAIHTFDQARFITGSHAISVYCHEFNPPGSWYEGNAAAICIFEMSNGSVFCYRGSWCADGAPTAWEAQWRITGEKGTAIWDGEVAPYAEIVEEVRGTVAESRRIEVDFVWDGLSGHAGCLDEMTAALREERPAETDCRDNILSMQMVMGALESARTGKKINLR